MDFYENVWVTDSVRCQIHKFDRNLRLLASYGGPGEGDGLFLRPAGIAIYRNFGQVFVGEGQGAHYFWIGTDLLSPNVQLLPGRPGLVQIHFELSEPAQGFIKAVSSGGAEKTLAALPGWTRVRRRFAFPCPRIGSNPERLLKSRQKPRIVRPPISPNA